MRRRVVVFIFSWQNIHPNRSTGHYFFFYLFICHGNQSCGEFIAIPNYVLMFTLFLPQFLLDGPNRLPFCPNFVGSNGGWLKPMYILKLSLRRKMSARADDLRTNAVHLVAQHCPLTPTIFKSQGGHNIFWAMQIVFTSGFGQSVFRYIFFFCFFLARDVGGG